MRASDHPLRDVELVPDWFDAAACRDADTSLFFLDRGQSSAAARALCAGCPVRVDCLDYAHTNDLDAGIFGGLAPRARQRLERKRAIASMTIRRAGRSPEMVSSRPVEAPSAS